MIIIVLSKVIMIQNICFIFFYLFMSIDIDQIEKKIKKTINIFFEF